MSSVGHRAQTLSNVSLGLTLLSVLFLVVSLALPSWTIVTGNGQTVGDGTGHSYYVA
jgi:hypothetical protein